MPADLLRVDLEPYDRVIAISDLHGHLRSFDSLLNYVAPTRQDLIITIGDYVDGGIDSCGVLDRLIQLHESSEINIHSLRGNHDQMMLDARDGPVDLDFWLNLGGQSTLASYPEESFNTIPEKHWQFLSQTCADLIEAETCLFVHG